MSREVRRVPPDWAHPRDGFYNDGTVRYIPLSGDSYKEEAVAFLEMANHEGLQAAVDNYGGAPDKNYFMPEWTPEEATHYMMYSTVSEGTPISPAFATPEELARWLADTGASSFGPLTATYDQWLRVCYGGWAPSMVTQGGQLTSGVEWAHPGGEE